MAIKMVQEKEQDKEDLRLANGEIIKRLQENSDFIFFMGILSKLRTEAMYQVLAIDVECKEWRSRLRTLDEIIGIPQDILKQAKIALYEQRTEE